MSDKKFLLGRKIPSGILALIVTLMGLQSFAVIPRSEAPWDLTVLLLILVTGIQMCWGAKAKWEKTAGIAYFVAAPMFALIFARGFGREMRSERLPEESKGHIDCIDREVGSWMKKKPKRLKNWRTIF